jgi:biopolymer transport protein ExbD
MGFGSFSGNGRRDDGALSTMADINVTPMVDVMLVLLVIFIIAAPMILPSIQLDLPKTVSRPGQQTAPAIHVSIDGNGSIYWDNQLVSAAELDLRFAGAAKQQPQPDLQLRADKATRYEVIARLMAAAQAQGLSKISFVTETEAAAH